MQLSLLTKDQITANMVAAIQSTAAAGGFTITMNPGSAMLAVVNACAGLYLWMQWLNIQVLTAARLATSFGTDCDSFGADFGFFRLAGTASSGLVVMFRYTTTSAAIVPVGSVIKTTDGTQSFTVLADPTNAAWQPANATNPNGSFLMPIGTASLTVSVANTIVGTAGNIIAGAIGLVAGVIPVDTVTNAAPFLNGMNPESDTAFKLRFGLFLISLAKSTSIAVQSAVLGVAQNLTCAVLNGVATVGGSFTPGYFVVAVDDGSGATPSATLGAIGAAVVPVMALGSTGTIVQAPVVPAVVVMTIACATPSLKASAQPLVTAAITAYIAALPVSTTAKPAPLPYNILSKLAFDASPNVLNVSGMTLNGDTADIGGAAGTVVRVAGVTVN